ncbi:hypothetical protein Drorol1_Dr00016730 [Drosera rotundifolia]
MGNCIEKPAPPPPPPPQLLPSTTTDSTTTTSAAAATVVVKLHGPASNPLTLYLRIALSYKTLTLRFIDTPRELYTLETLDDAVSGSAESILEYAESRFPQPPLLARGRGKGWDEEMVGPMVVRMGRLQHRSMRRHVERVVEWGAEVAARGGKSAGKVEATPRVEVRRFAKRYGMLLDVLLEHAQMEERVVFPVIQGSDPGVCMSANEDHGRDLPIMNGIKEAIKSIVAIDPGTPDFREALNDLSSRLETLQDNCKKHFEEEEKYVFPLMEAADDTIEQEKRMLSQCIDLMPGTHSHLFSFFIEGLLPHEAIQYLDLLLNYNDQERAAQMFRTLIDERHFKRLRHSLGEVLQQKEDHFENKLCR